MKRYRTLILIWIIALAGFAMVFLYGCATPPAPFHYDDSGRMAVITSREPGPRSEFEVVKK